MSSILTWSTYIIVFGALGGLALPFIALLLTVIFARETTLGNIGQRIQAALMIIMTIICAYLCILPNWTKWQRV